MFTFTRRTSVLAVCAASALAAVSFPAHVAAAEATVGMGNAGSYAVLAGSTVTNTGPSTVSGDLGVSPGTAVTGFPPGVVSNGVVHAADAEAAGAQAALATAFNDAAGRASTGAISADLAGQTLIPGVYTGGALLLSGTLTLDAQGDPDAVFIFQAASSLTTGSGSRVSLINSAGSCNVFWQVGSSAVIGTSSEFVGTVLALTSITAQTNASIEGRLLARNGAVTLDSNTFSRPSCAAAVPTTTTTAAGTTVPGNTVPGDATSSGGTTPQIPATGGGTLAPLTAALAAVLAGGGLVLAVRRSPSSTTR